jgi:hypothetical protein
MNDNRLGGLALMLGAVSGLVTLTFHPGGGGQHRVTQAQFETLIVVIIGVHAFAITGLPVSFAGALALIRRIDSPLRLALLGLIVYGFGLAAMMAAATISGLVSPDILRQIVARSAASDQWQILMTYNHSINQGFARVGAVAFSVAILLWSLLIVKRRSLPIALGIYGMISAIGVIAALFSGLLDLDLHGFRVITLIEALWFFLAGLFLWKTHDSAVQSANSPSA